MEQKFIEFYTNHMFKCNDLESAILKGHILTENCLDNYLKGFSKSGAEPLYKFSYFNKLLIAEAFGLFVGQPQMKNAFTILNSLRNSIAHKLEYDKVKFIEFMKVFDVLKSKHDIFNLEKLNKDEYVDFAVGHDSKKVHFSQLRVTYLIVFLCGFIIGRGEKATAKKKDW